MNNFRVWLHGLVAAGIGGACNAFTVAVIDPQHFAADAWKYAGVGSLIAVALFLKQSPLPPMSDAAALLAAAKREST